MRERNARRVLWIGLLAMAPLPLHLIGDGLVPVARMLLLAGVCIGMLLVEGAGGVAPLLAAGFLAYAATSAAVLWLAAALAARLMRGLSPATRARLVCGGLLLGLALASGLDVYRTPFGTAATGNLLQVLR